ncbi:hypothetical protein ACFVX6_06530 [Streptomyces sp. NPDC058289]|uniref:hypothetical protein n=1 Tax=Streptomyces sp. NPDC058289 TaxID=3346425 RepID=UPI0036EC1626
MNERNRAGALAQIRSQAPRPSGPATQACSGPCVGSLVSREGTYGGFAMTRSYRRPALHAA